MPKAAMSIERLQNCDLGYQLSPDSLAALWALCHNQTVEPEAFLFSQHSPATGTYLVNEGVMRVEKLSASGRRQVVAFLFPGDFLGFTHHDYYEYSAIAVTPASILKMPRSAFLALADKDAQLKRNLAEISNNVLSRALDQVFALGQKKAHERVCFMLAQLQERFPGSSPDQLNLPMTRQDMADYLGLTIETVSRALAKLKAEGVITDIRLHSMGIADRDALNAYASLD